MVSLSYFREILSAVAIGLTLISFLPYIRSVKRGTTRPHIFSWIIWGSTTLVVFAAQLADGGGVGAWPIGVSGAVTIYVAGLAWTKKSDITITTADRLFLRTMVELARNFEMETVAEWVIDEETARIAADTGIDYLQGFHLGRPVRPEEVCNIPVRPAPRS